MASRIKVGLANQLEVRGGGQTPGTVNGILEDHIKKIRHAHAR